MSLLQWYQWPLTPHSMIIYSSLELQDEKHQRLDVDSIEALPRLSHIHGSQTLLIKLKFSSQKKLIKLRIKIFMHKDLESRLVSLLSDLITLFDHCVFKSSSIVTSKYFIEHREMMASSHLRTSTAPTASLMSLPLEVREKIYEQHLLDHSSSSSHNLHSSFSAKFPDEQIPLLTVSKQISAEISFIFRRKTPLLSSTYRIISQSATFDPYTRAQFVARRESLNLGAVQHLNVAVYKPALPQGWKDEKTMKVEMARLWARVRDFGIKLRRRYRCLSTLTVRFPETEGAEWCHANIRSCGSMVVQERRTDVGYMLELLASLRCAEEAKVWLPRCVEGKFDGGREWRNSYEVRRLRGVVEGRMVGSGTEDEGKWDEGLLWRKGLAICGDFLGERWIEGGGLGRGDVLEAS